MFFGSLDEEQIDSLITIVSQMKDDLPDFMKYESSLKAFDLMWFQCMCVAHALTTRGSLCSLDTGLGKTAVSAAYVKENLKDNPDSKAFFFCLPESLEQTTKDYLDYLDYKVVTTSGASSDLNYLFSLPENSYDIVIASTQALYSVWFMNYLLNLLPSISCAVFDEVHELSQESIINSVVTQLCVKLPSKLFLTATPITVSPVQSITILNMLDSQFIPQGSGLLKPYEIYDPETFELVDYKPLGDLANDFYPRYISFTRSELGLQGEYKPHLLLVDPTKEQMECSASEIETVIKGDPNSKQVKVLEAVCIDMKNAHKTGLIYCDTRANSEMLCTKLRVLGIRAFVANGVPSNKKLRAQVIELFKQRQIDILITNLTTSLNLPCDFLIFWENTNKAVQMLGRCVRGFIRKTLDVYFILTDDTVEIDQFYRNVYRRAKWLSEAFAKDTTLFLKVQKALERRKLVA